MNPNAQILNTIYGAGILGVLQRRKNMTDPENRKVRGYEVQMKCETVHNHIFDCLTQMLEESQKTNQILTEMLQTLTEIKEGKQ